MDTVSIVVEDLSPLMKPVFTSSYTSVNQEAQDVATSVYPPLTTDSPFSPSQDKHLDNWGGSKNPWTTELPYTSIDERDRALAISLLASRTSRASRAHLEPGQSSQLSLWADGGLSGMAGVKHTDHAGIGIVQRPSPSCGIDPDTAWWQTCYAVRGIHLGIHVEVLAIVEAIKIAYKQCRQLREEESDRLPTTVNIFSDSQNAIQCFQARKRGKQSYRCGRLLALRAARSLNHLRCMNVMVHLRWVPGHSSDRGNHWADRAARLAIAPCLVQHVASEDLGKVTWVYYTLQKDMVKVKQVPKNMAKVKQPQRPAAVNVISPV